MDSGEQTEIRTMTKADLIEALEFFDDDTPVLFSYTYGDYWRSKVAEGIQEVEEQDIHWSDYHSMYKITEEEYSDQANHPTRRKVIIIR